MIRALESFFGSPITWGVVALVALALALSGKLSIGAARLVLWLALGAAVFGVFRAEVFLKTEPLMRFLILGCCAFGFAAGTLALDRWMGSPKTAEVIPNTQFPPAGFVTFLGQVLDGNAPMIQANQTDVPLDDVHLSITQSILKSASDPGPWQVGWQKEIEIGTCRAKLTVGLPERFPVRDHNWIRFDIFMLTRLQTYREIINLTKESEKEYKAELNFYNGAEVNPSYTQTMKLGIVNLSSRPDQPGPGPIPPGMSDSVSTVVTPVTPKGGAMIGGFQTTGAGEYEIDILQVPPEELLFNPPGTLVERNKLPVRLTINGHNMTVVRFTGKGFVINDNGWRDIPVSVALVRASARPASPEQTDKSRNGKSDLLPQIAKDVGEIKKNVIPTQRHLSEGQRSKLASLLRAGGSYETAVRHSQGNIESQTYADEFVAVFQEAGWTVNPRPKFLIQEHDAAGIWIMVEDISKAPLCASLLQQSLKKIGIEASGLSVPGLSATPETTCELFVGLKPN